MQDKLRELEALSKQAALENFYLVKEANPTLAGIGLHGIGGAGVGNITRGATREDIKKKYKLSDSEIGRLERQGGYNPELFNAGAGLVGSTAGALLGGAIAGPRAGQDIGMILGGVGGWGSMNESQQKLMMRRAEEYAKKRRTGMKKKAALENFYLVKEGKLAPAWIDKTKKAVDAIKQTTANATANAANQATLYMGRYRVTPGGATLGKSFDAGAGAGNMQTLMASNRKLAVQQAMNNPHVRKQMMADLQTRGMEVMRNAQVGGGNWAIARKLSNQLIF